MPERSSNRPISGQAAQAGDEWQNRVVGEVQDIFGSENVWVHPTPAASPNSGKVQRPAQRELSEDMDQLQAHQFVVESIFDLTDSFKAAFGLHGLSDSKGLILEWSRLNPDIIQALPSKPDSLLVTSDGRLTKMAADDSRLRLRIIDVKLASEPGAHYFGEIAFYSIALASWLETQTAKEKGWNERFVVSAEAAVWPGSYQSSNLSNEFGRQLTGGRNLPLLLEAMEEDLETIVFEVYASRLARFFRQELPNLLQTPWEKLDWHPNFRCQNCDYLGYDWQAGIPLDPAHPRKHPDPRHCWQEAETKGLSCRIPGLTRGGAQKLNSVAPTVSELAKVALSDSVWDKHSNLRGRKQIFLARAKSLMDGQSSIVSESGACATMPSWVDLKIYITLDYDPSSAVTAVLSMRADWREPDYKAESLAQAPGLIKNSFNWGQKVEDIGVWMVDVRDVEVEKREFLRFLEVLQGLIDSVKKAERPRIEAGKVVQDTENARRSAAKIKGRVENKERPSTFQIYLWDDAQFRHLQRLIGRHLTSILANPKLKGLAWLFPAPQLLPDEAYAGRTSPITLVSTVVDSHVAVPVPHHYTLLEVASHFSPNSAPKPFVKWNYKEPLTNLVPSERIHEWWTRRSNWRNVQRDLESTSQHKTYALSLVTGRLYEEARKNNLLLASSAAPPLPVPSKTLAGVPDEARLWYQHLRLNAAIARIEAEINYALSPETREIRGKSAHLVARLTNETAISTAIKSIKDSCGVNLEEEPGIVIYSLSPLSRDVNMKPGEFGAFLSPRGEELFALKSSGARLKNSKARLDAKWWQSIEKEGLTGVSVEAIDRQGLYVALRMDENNQIYNLIASDNADFSRNVMLDALPFDWMSGKVKLTLERAGTPAFELSLLGIENILPPTVDLTAPVVAAKFQPAHEFLYNPVGLYQAVVGRDSQKLRQVLEAELEAERTPLNSYQWVAWRNALERRLSVIWGPPGTGKSATLRAICRAAVMDAERSAKPLRLLITAHTYTAVDELLGKIEKHFAKHPVANLSIYRVQSSFRSDPDLDEKSNIHSIILNRTAPCPLTHQLLDALKNPGQKIVIVGTVPTQLHNLAQVGVKTQSEARTQQNWFDLVLLDEASQMDVVGSSLIWSKMATNGACVLAGDDKQMSPIHQAEPPQGQENLVGSIFDYYTKHFDIPKSPLNINYRSNSTIVDCVRAAGYDDDLQSHSQNLELNLTAPIPVAEPANWPAQLPFSTHYREMLDSKHPTGCFVYADPNLSGQSNDFEAQTLAAMLRLLYESMAKSKNRLDEKGQPLVNSDIPYGIEDFWKYGVGVVAPHRAQGSKIVEALRVAFDGTGATPAMIRDAVDTVERFQGQERDVIVASFGLGDPDLVALEDEFLYNLNRFNVLISRACAKVLVFLSRAVLDYLSDDQKVVADSALLKSYAEVQCSNTTTLELPYIESDGIKMVSGEFRYR